MWTSTDLKVLCVDSQGRKLLKGQLNDSSVSLKCKRDIVICCSFLKYMPFQKNEFRAFEMHNVILLHNISLVSSHKVGKGKNQEGLLLIRLCPAAYF